MSLNHTAMAALAAAAICGAAHGAEMTLYKQPRFAGDGITVTNAARDLAPLGITDQASSLVVRGDRWEVCTQPDFTGDCRTLAPGEYATLDPVLNHRIESVRRVERSARSRERDDWRADARGYEPPDDGGWAYGDRDRPRGGDAWRR